MKQYFHAFVMCQSMFCAIPFPCTVWDEDARDKMLLFLPVIGLEIGLIWAGTAYLAAFLQLSQLITAFILCALPYTTTGFIHLDGFMDVTDAIKSCRDPEKRRAILKDPHVGSFAVIGCVLLMLAQYALFAAVSEGWCVLIFLPVVTRCCSAYAITVLPPMATSQYARQGGNKSHKYTFLLMLYAAVALGFVFAGIHAVALLFGTLGSVLSIRKGVKSLGGMNGDISGYALTIGELWGIAALSVLGGIV